MLSRIWVKLNLRCVNPEFFSSRGVLTSTISYPLESLEVGNKNRNQRLPEIQGAKLEDLPRMLVETKNRGRALERRMKMMLEAPHSLEGQCL